MQSGPFPSALLSGNNKMRRLSLPQLTIVYICIRSLYIRYLVERRAPSAVQEDRVLRRKSAGGLEHWGLGRSRGEDRPPDRPVGFSGIPSDSYRPGPMTGATAPASEPLFRSR